MAFYLMASSKKGFSAHQLHRALGVTYKSAWFMAHRIREAMRAGGLMPPLGGEGKIVEADETYYGEVERAHAVPQRSARPPLINAASAALPASAPSSALVERGGQVRTFHVAVANKAAVGKIVTEMSPEETCLHTDESRLYGDADQLFAEHHTVKHSAGEYVRYEGRRAHQHGRGRVQHLQARHARHLPAL